MSLIKHHAMLEKYCFIYILLALTDSLETVIWKTLGMGVFSYNGMAGNPSNVSMILKLKPGTSPWKGYNLQREIRFSMRNWLSVLYGDIRVKWCSVSIKHIKNIVHFCKAKKVSISKYQFLSIFRHTAFKCRPGF